MLVNDFGEPFHHQIQVHGICLLILFEYCELSYERIEFHSLLLSQLVALHLFPFPEHVLAQLKQVLPIPAEHHLADNVSEFWVHLILIFTIALKLALLID